MAESTHSNSNHDNNPNNSVEEDGSSSGGHPQDLIIPIGLLDLQIRDNQNHINSATSSLTSPHHRQQQQQQQLQQPQDRLLHQAQLRRQAPHAVHLLRTNTTPTTPQQQQQQQQRSFPEQQHEAPILSTSTSVSSMNGQDMHVVINPNNNNNNNTGNISNSDVSIEQQQQQFAADNNNNSNVASGVNAYYQGQRQALYPSDPELGQPTSGDRSLSMYGGSSNHTAPTGWATVDTIPGSVPPCERSLHSAAVLNGSLYVFGGYNGQARVNDFHAFSFTHRRWAPVLPVISTTNNHNHPTNNVMGGVNNNHTTTTSRPPSPRDRHVSVVYGSSFYVFGGFDGTSRTNDFFGFDFTSMVWREIIPRSGRPPSERHSHAAVVHNHSMYVFGGYDGSYKSDLFEFDFILSKWSVVPAAGRRPRARYRATCVVHKNQMILFGGHDGTRHLSDTHMFDFETRIWTAVVTDGIPPIPRDSHVSVVWNGSMYIFGGSSGSAMSDLHELQLPSTTSTSSSSPTNGAPAASLNMNGGGGGDVGVIAKWRQVKASAPTDLPGQRFCHVAAVYHDAMYVFGGYDGSERLNDFIRFDFAAHDLSFEVPPSSLITDLRNLVDDDTLSDITFIVEDQPVYAHKLILMRSSYFRALFLGDMRESRLSTIRIEQVRHSIFLSVLEYLYTDQVQIPLDCAMELFEAADLFCIPRLKTMCEKRMLCSIHVENAATIFLAADMHTATALRRKALKYILSHFEDVSKTDSFEDMGRNNMDLLFEILRNR